jgi:hypothetical protein
VALLAALPATAGGRTNFDHHQLLLLLLLLIP